MLKSILMVALMVLGAAQPGGEPEAEIREAYSAYQDAVRARDPQAVAAIVTPATLQYSDWLRSLVLEADDEELARRGHVNQLRAYMLRAYLTEEEFNAMSGREVSDYLTELGWPLLDIWNFEVGAVLVSGRGDSASFNLTRDGQETPLAINAHLTEEGWRLAPNSLNFGLNAALDARIERGEITASDFFDARLRAMGYEPGLDDHVRTPLSAR